MSPADRADTTPSSALITTDILIIGAGIVGLSMARACRQRYPDLKITVLEKEATLGCHASGRNSGVLHSGIYYPENTIKAKVCVEGRTALAAYCQDNHLPLSLFGKVIVPVSADQDSQLDMLYHRAQANGATVELWNESQLKAHEPMAHSASGRALFSPNTGVFDPKAILNYLHQELTAQQVSVLLNQQVTDIQPAKRVLKTPGNTFSYGYLINTAGLYADKIAEQCGLSHRYAMLPFKGLYYELSPGAAIQLNSLLYPVPDLRVPFLGVHFTRAVSGKIYAGPTAIPAFGRENYQGLDSIDWSELPGMLGLLAQQYLLNHQGFREYTHQEAFRFFKTNFVAAAQALVPSLKPDDLVPSHKVGIRAQLLDLQTQSLVMDFLVEQSDSATHILNAVSPAFTSAFAFADLVLEQYTSLGLKNKMNSPQAAGVN